MFTPRSTVRLLRVGAVLCGIGMAVLMLGPFQGLEHVVGLSDKSAHAVAFYAATLGTFSIAPRWRRHDLALLVFVAAIASEIFQGFTGRSMSLSDLLADLTGIGIALVPGAVETLRRLARAHPDLTFAEIRFYDRRKRGGRWRFQRPAALRERSGAS
jgi:VanZ family protein